MGMEYYAAPRKQEDHNPDYLPTWARILKDYFSAWSDKYRKL